MTRGARRGAALLAVLGVAGGGIGWTTGAVASASLAMTVTGVPPSVASLAFWDGTAGLAGGHVGADGQIWETIDAGHTWRAVWHGAPVTQVTTAGDRTAYAVAGADVLRTMDGGRSWTTLPAVNGETRCGLSVPCVVAVATSGATVYGVGALSSAVGTNPVALAPYGSWLYVSNGSGTVSAFNLKTGRIGWTVGIGNAPGGLAVSPNGRTLYVAEQNAARVAVVSLARHRVAATIPVVANPSPSWSTRHWAGS